VCVLDTHTHTLSLFLSLSLTLSHHVHGMFVGGKHTQEQHRSSSIPADTAGCGVWCGQERIGGAGGGNEHKRDGEGAGTNSQKSACRDFVGGEL
jgi:hypothetical protein